ncbi:hypothetical protein EX30DRAFT_339430 [Ascodesmis nigricans]|uniref:Protein FRA10AC1 n=1 Tax=Ascodesmis nigricans TaxID=341454 RepID=A0A4S2N251_9PEZI|nr:hypothetical protein EX30DRAFT_339430 [Ascodesmis nigricans]
MSHQPPINDKAFRQSYAPTSAYTRHLIASAAQAYYYNNPPPAPSTVRTERDILEEHHRFLRDDGQDEKATDDSKSEEKELARRYYDKLFKEYAVVDLSRWREGMVGMRWRTADEVRNGKGQDICGSLNCKVENNLEVREVDFAYEEEGKSKRALVKVQLCRECRRKLRKAQDKEGTRSERHRSSHGQSRDRKESRHGHRREDRRRARTRSRSRDRSRSPKQR